MSVTWTIRRGRVLAAGAGVLSAWACTVADKGDYTFTDTPGTGGSSAGKGTGGSSTAAKGGTSGEAGVMETGGTGGLGGRGGRGSIGGRGGKAGQAGASGEAGEGGAAAVGGTGGTSGNAGEAGESGAGGEAGMTSVNTCGDGHVDSGEACDLGANNGVTACTYGQTSCTVCTKQCTRAAGAATYCGDGKRQSSHEQCDDGNTTTEGCPTHGTCTACDSTCKLSVPRTCGDGSNNGDTLTSITIESLGIVAGCAGGSASYSMPYFLNGLELPNVPQSACTCSANSSVVTLSIQDPIILAAVRPVGNVFELRTDASYPALVGWARLTFNFQNGAPVVLTPFDFDGEASSSGADLCFGNSNYAYAPQTAPAFDMPRVEQCDGGVGCDSECITHVVPNFAGELGPSLDGWTQCEGYLDTEAGDELPSTGWGSACKVADYKQLLFACGDSLSHYRYIIVNGNLLRDGLPSGSELDGAVTGAFDQDGVAFAADGTNEIYANSSVTPDSSTTWWYGPSGCNELANNLTINNSCPWEVSNCFGQNLAGDRHLWVYIQ
jgi:cysteine-rich repeat protein